MPLLVTALVVGCSATSMPAEPKPPTTDLNAQLGKLHVPGLSAGIVKEGKLVWSDAVGKADIEHDVAATTDTIFAWASVSKTITATALMILYDEGKFGLDDDVDHYLPFAINNPHCPTKPITFRQVLSHVSSIADNEDVYNATYVVDADSPIPLSTFLRSYLVSGGAEYDAVENFHAGCPGTYHDYSNIAGGGLVGYLVEQISGKPFDQFARDRIFAPLGMTETSFRLADLDRSKVAMPYEADAGGFMAVGHQGYITYPDGLLRTSVPHLARFLMMFANHGELDGVRILAPSTVDELRRVQYPELDKTQALIWYYDNFGSHIGMIGHDGEDDGTSSLMFFDPAARTGALLVANSVWWDYDRGAAAEKLLGELLDQAARRAVRQ